MTYHNYPAYVFRATSFLEKLGVKSARYVHKDEVNFFCNQWLYKIQYEIMCADLVKWADERVSKLQQVGSVGTAQSNEPK